MALSVCDSSDDCPSSSGDDDIDVTDDDDDDDDNEPTAEPDLFECSIDRPEQDRGLVYCETGASEGYTLLAPMASTTTYLLDMFGKVVNQWESDFVPGLSAYFLENGNLLRTYNSGPNKEFPGGGKGGGVQIIDWDGNVLWDYQVSTDLQCHHHDAQMLPNGNVLMIIWEMKTGTESIEAGRNPALLREKVVWADLIIEVKPEGENGGTVVWQWSTWDHIVQEFDSTKANFGVVADHPELIDLNFSTNGAADWNHTNSVDYNEALDQILLSVRAFSEVWVIDHSTTTAQAAGPTGGQYGKGGDLLYRWGNPAAYQAGTEADRRLFQQHAAGWIAEGLEGEGDILVYNNGVMRSDNHFSTVEQITPPIALDGSYAPFGPDDLTWSFGYEPADEFYSSHFSGASRLPNGNTLIAVGANGQIFEVTEEGRIDWNYINPLVGENTKDLADTGSKAAIFRAYRYAPDFPGFAGKDMTPGGEVMP